ncbi:hypothetical protein N7445_005338 [Penicillium cf. griseofulvum]|nr:hypothetical protein N7445_005338 [Penicillium cf. griseofulvum]
MINSPRLNREKVLSKDETITLRSSYEKLLRRLPPTVVLLSENEGGNFYSRSLISRLSEYYPLSLLEINYRCHPEILDWPTSAIYKGKITAND